MNIEISYHLYEIDIENYRHDPTVKTICMLAEALQVAPEDLYSYVVK